MGGSSVGRVDGLGEGIMRFIFKQLFIGLVVVGAGVAVLEYAAYKFPCF